MTSCCKVIKGAISWHKSGICFVYNSGSWTDKLEVIAVTALPLTREQLDLGQEGGKIENFPMLKSCNTNWV